MIAGVGVDVVHDRQLPDGVLVPSDPFFARTFSAREVAQARESGSVASYCRGRFAAKEAVFKSLGMPSDELGSWNDIEVLSDENDAPSVELHASAARAAEARGIKALFVSISVDEDCHVALCVAER